MHPIVQGIIAASCLALVALGGFAVYSLNTPREVVQIEAEPTLQERAFEESCAVFRQVDPTGLATPVGRNNPGCYDR
jgi:hypothetical protein